MALNQYLGDAEQIGLKLLLSFARAFVGALIITLPGVLASPDFSTGKALAISALVGAVTAGVRAVQAAIAKL